MNWTKYCGTDLGFFFPPMGWLPKTLHPLLPTSAVTWWHPLEENKEKQKNLQQFPECSLNIQFAKCCQTHLSEIPTTVGRQTLASVTIFSSESRFGIHPRNFPSFPQSALRSCLTVRWYFKRQQKITHVIWDALTVALVPFPCSFASSVEPLAPSVLLCSNNSEIQMWH